MAGLNAKVHELPVMLGKQASLIGIMTEAGPATGPVVVLLNAGIVHRVGPNRLHVQLARALAESNYASLRFDLSGIGDSPNRADAQSILESAMSDIRDALDWLEAKRQVRKVILLGLCAGADNAVLYASSDRRVVGIVLLDPTIPRTKKYHINELGRQIISLASKTPKEAFGSIANLLKRNLPAPTEIGMRADEPVEPNLDDDQLRVLFESHYRHCALSGVNMLAMFTGGMQRQHNYREQLVDAFPGVAFGDRLTLEYLAQSDHTFTSEANREQLTRSVLKWMRTVSFGASNDVAEVTGAR